MTQKPLNKPLLGPDFLHCPSGVFLVSSISALGEWRTNAPQFPQFTTVYHSVRDLRSMWGIFSQGMWYFLPSLSINYGILIVLLVLQLSCHFSDLKVACYLVRLF